METKNKVNFNDVQINDFILAKEYGTKDFIKIYKVIEIDDITYNAGFNNFYKIIKMELYSVPNGNIDFYKEVRADIRCLIFWEDNFEYLAPEPYQLIDLKNHFKNVYNQIHNTNY
jgi:hypothetical protein